MSRLPGLAFAALVVATVGAFFVTQHLKVTTPLIAGPRGPAPAVFNPLDGTVCGGTDYRRTTISFYLLHRSDNVDVYVIDQGGNIVRTLASGRYMRGGKHPVRAYFAWDGREDNGRIAPDGGYYIQVALIHQGRTVVISNTAGREPITVKTSPPRPVVDSVSPQLIDPDRHIPVTIHYSGNGSRSGTVVVYRTDLPGGLRLVKSFATRWNAHTAVWDGLIQQRPAPAGTYLIGLDVTDAACNTGHFPVVNPPPPGVTPHAGVTVRYLAAQPPMRPVIAGSAALVYIDSRQQRYRWSLRRAGVRKALASGRSDRFDLRVPVPAGAAGLYELHIRSGSHSTAVPLAASGARRARVLVVLPALAWQGLNTVDDDGDGLPDTLQAGGPIELERPLANGLPAGFSDEAAFLAYLDRSHHAYDLTTDLGLIDRVDPGLAGHTAVVLAGSERWLPSALASALRSYVLGGGHLVSLGIDSLRRTVTVQGRRALDPTSPSSAADVLGARLAPVVAHSTELITVLRDGLGIFQGTAGALAGWHSYQPIAGLDPPAQILSEAGTSAGAVSIVGYRLGRGVVVDIGLPGFGLSLAGNVDAQELVARVWKVLSG